MSDFDVVLERLVADPSFAAALAVDPVAALAGYRLDPDEIELLHSQVGGAAPTEHAVETRANQSSLFGMLSPLAGLVGEATATAGQGDSSGSSRLHETGTGTVQRFESTTYTSQSMRGGHSSAGPLAAAGGAIGAVDRVSGADPVSADRVSGFGAAGAGPIAGIGDRIARATEELPTVPEGYRTRVDVDGDGRWDDHTLRARSDGGVDILVDVDGDGRVDFVGRDTDADGLVDVTDHDTDRDGVFETRGYDDNGDGWLDRTVRIPPPRP
ncbi:hypothetical protein [Polymorphospora rubra]|uniref:Uncharacterized protein n=1 Tax=Polymorphospora rubra TaxID=338584 RepID=A0A810N525_9ACTN|nr:hypothetical protein [Polymorphospora rubra]BCJ66575.1 hypothetical protein Prubr_35960 [Polymorphospora rubra]